MHDEESKADHDDDAVARHQAEISKHESPPPATPGDHGRDTESNLGENSKGQHENASIAQETEERHYEGKATDHAKEKAGDEPRKVRVAPFSRWNQMIAATVEHEAVPL